MSVRSGDLTEKWYEYVYRDESESVRRFVERYPDERTLSVSCEQFGHDYRFVRPLLTNPDEVLQAGKTALRRFLPDGSDRDLCDVYLRVTDLPEESEVSISDLDASHLNRLLTTRGIVTETGPVRPKVVRAGFRCAKCETITRFVAQPGRELRTNAKCPRCNSVGYLTFAPEGSEYVDAQEVTVRDPDRVEERRSPGERTGLGDDVGATILLEHDLTGTVSVGDEVRVVAIPRASPDRGSTVGETWVESVSMGCLTSASR